jgi:DNA polymerase-3 subunit beta
MSTTVETGQMSTIFNRGALMNALEKVNVVVPARSSKPMLQCIRMKADGDGRFVSLFATDLTMFVECRITQIQIESLGEFCVSAEKLAVAIARSGGDTVSIKAVGDDVELSGPDTRFRFYRIPRDEFPKAPDLKGDPDFAIAAGELARMIGQTLFAAAKESARYAFNGCLLEAKGNKVSLVATDGQRLAIAKGDLISSVAVKNGISAVIPTKALSVIGKLAEDDVEQPVNFRLRDEIAEFQLHDSTLAMNLIVGQFPPYKDVIPKNCDKKLIVSAADFIGAVEAAGMFSEAGRLVHPLAVELNRKGAKLSSRDPGYGEASVDLPCRYEGADIKIGFSKTFLMEGARAANADEITIELAAPNQPTLMKGADGFQYVVMPAQLEVSP